jgi:hypothetical protein
MKDFYAQLDNEEVVEEIDATIDEAEVILNDNATSVDE